MSTNMQIKQSETGLVRLFAVDLPPKEALALKERPDALATLLGVPTLDSAHFELFDLRDLAGLGLEGYLSDGHGIAEDRLAPHRWTLDALEGVVLLVRSAAIRDKPAVLRPRAPLRWIATFGEETSPVPLRPDLPRQSARGTLSPPPDDPGRPRGTLLSVVLGLILTLAVAFALYILLS